jgi:hypothetical protein
MPRPEREPRITATTLPRSALIRHRAKKNGCGKKDRTPAAQTRHLYCTAQMIGTCGEKGQPDRHQFALVYFVILLKLLENSSNDDLARGLLWDSGSRQSRRLLTLGWAARSLTLSALVTHKGPGGVAEVSGRAIVPIARTMERTMDNAKPTEVAASMAASGRSKRSQQPEAAASRSSHSRHRLRRHPWGCDQPRRDQRRFDRPAARRSDHLSGRPRPCRMSTDSRCGKGVGRRNGG